MFRSILGFVVFVFSTLLLGSMATVAGLLRPKSYMTLRLGRVWSRWILAAAGLKPTYEGLEHVEASTPCIFLANHQSLLDVWSITPALPDPTIYVAKKSLFRIPVLGASMRSAGFVHIDRGNRRRAIDSLRRAAERIRSGRPVLLFPEGTRSRTGELGPFKKGAFRLALEARVPLVPVSVSGTWEALPPGRLIFKKVPIRVRFGEPIDVSGAGPNDMPELMDRVREAILSGLDRASAAPAQPPHLVEDRPHVGTAQAADVGPQAGHPPGR